MMMNVEARMSKSETIFKAPRVTETATDFVEEHRFGNWIFEIGICFEFPVSRFGIRAS